MDRRQSLKLLLACAVGSERLLATEVGDQSSGFASDWESWPDMRWAGPSYWGNRLQDWAVESGALVCRTRGPNRTLHCLTHNSIGRDFETSVSVDIGTTPGAPAPDARVGFRIGAKGRFDDYRSAAVFGRGIDAGVDGDGRLFIGESSSATRVDSPGPLRLTLRVIGSNDSATVVLSVRHRDDGPVLADLSTQLAAERTAGGLALLSDYGSASPEQPAAAFSHWVISGPGIEFRPDHVFGPVMFAQYTVHQQILKLTAQLAPIDTIANVVANLETMSATGNWRSVAQSAVDPLSRTAHFRVTNWEGTDDVNYRIRISIPLTTGVTDFTYDGTIAAEPDVATPLRAAVFSCNADHGFPDTEVVQNVKAQAPDIALFLGDQYYESHGGFGIQTDSLDEALLDMLAKWYMFGWSYRDIFRDIPSAFIPDDHDVYHGNIWGENGKVTPTDEGWGAVAQDQGGYKMPAPWVNAVQRTQTSHLPDPYDPTPVQQGIDVYYTRWDYAGISFAILEDRKFKSAPGNVLPDAANVVNGWIQNPDFDVRQHRDIPNATLLGDRQTAFLRDWATDWRGPSFMKVVLSQTNFAAVHTIPETATSGSVLPRLPVPQLGEYVLGDKLAVDMDSNGWPQNDRDETLRILRSCSAFHIAGDQHLATVVRHGIDEFDDACYTFTVPALNNIWPRRWWPPQNLKERALQGAPMYAGAFRDGFGNRITVHASANPRATGLEPSIIRDRVTGYGIVEFDRITGQVTMECWPRYVDPSRGENAQYDGWPISVNVNDDGSRNPLGFLPTLRISGLATPVVSVVAEDGTHIYTRRISDSSFRPPVFDEGVHIVRAGNPETDVWKERRVTQEEWNTGFVDFVF